jgi:heme A synthase
MLFYAHSGVRYLVLVAGVLTLGFALYGTVARRPYDPMMLRLARVFAASVHLQVLLGVALLLTGRFYPALIGHIAMMAFAAAVATLVPAVMRRRDPGARTWLPHVIGTVVALALIWLGVLAIGRSPLGMGTPGG